MCKEVVEKANTINFSNKKNQIVWRGGGTNDYRKTFVEMTSKYPTHFDVKHVSASYSYENNICTNHIYSNPISLTRYDKLFYKYQLHLNGHMGNSRDGAYSSALKWSLMTKSLVFYCCSDEYIEFWSHEKIFKPNYHYIHCKNENELLDKLLYYKNNETEAETIAQNGFELFNKYLLNYDLRYYMLMLFTEYKKKLGFEVSFNPSDNLIENDFYHKFFN
jgi:hypothetical protein